MRIKTMYYLTFAMIGIMPTAATAGTLIQTRAIHMSVAAGICYGIAIASMLAFMILRKAIENSDEAQEEGS